MDSGAIADAVRSAIGEAATGLRPDVREAIERAREAEASERAQSVLTQLLDNDDIARSDRVPVCQDTGAVWVRLELGLEERLDADPQDIIDEAVARAYGDHSLRMSLVRDALCDRANTGDNTPALVDVSLRPGTGATVEVMLKGGGSDNSSALVMLPPSAGAEGIADAVVDHAVAKATGACPPLIVGVGVGGTFDTVAKLSKRALLRSVGGPGAACAADLEHAILARINASGIGPAGLGGKTTALAVHVETAPCHIATLPVAVNLGCCALRSARVDLA